MGTKKLLKTSEINTELGIIEYNEFEIKNPDIDDLMQMLIISQATLQQMNQVSENIDYRLFDFDEDSVSI